MDETTVYKRSRSSFYLRVNENEDGGYNFFISEVLRPVFDYHFSEVKEASPTGWRSGKKNTQNIWVPENCADQIDVDKIKEWAEFAGNQCVWLTLSKHLQGHFSGRELDYCIAADFNFTSEDGEIDGRSKLGEAEYYLKYRLAEISKEEKEHYCSIMAQVLLDVIGLLPCRTKSFGSLPLVSPIPTNSGSSRLAWAFAKHIAEKKGLTFLEPTLTVPKPKMKKISIEEKIAKWNAIYATANAVDFDPESVKRKTVIVIDDLYQSGVTIWAYAKFLKGIGARRVYGLACVKSMKDTDNQ